MKRRTARLKCRLFGYDGSCRRVDLPLFCPPFTRSFFTTRARLMLSPNKLLPLPLLLCALIVALGPRAVRADDWYQPQAADFHPLYDRDAADQKYQKWDGRDSYWYWVQTFYGGYRKRVLGVSVVRQAGWTAASRDLVCHVTAQPARQTLTLSLNTLGRAIAGEWAKNDHAGRIHTRDLRRWNDMISDAGKRDSGSGQVLLASVRSVQAEVDRRLAGRP